MPRVVPCWRSYNRPKTDKDGKTVMEPVVEKLMMLEPDADEAVRNGKGEWSRTAPKDENVRVTELESRAMPVDTETRSEVQKKRRI